jgi:hypothetical protein
MTRELPIQLTSTKIYSQTEDCDYVKEECTK